MKLRNVFMKSAVVLALMLYVTAVFSAAQLSMAGLGSVAKAATYPNATDWGITGPNGYSKSINRWSGVDLSSAYIDLPDYDLNNSNTNDYIQSIINNYKVIITIGWGEKQGNNEYTIARMELDTERTGQEAEQKKKYWFFKIALTPSDSFTWQDDGREVLLEVRVQKPWEEEDGPQNIYYGAGDWRLVRIGANREGEGNWVEYGHVNDPGDTIVLPYYADFDVSDEDECEAYIDTILAGFDRIAVWINNGNYWAESRIAKLEYSAEKSEELSGTYKRNLAAYKVILPDAYYSTSGELKEFYILIFEEPEALPDDLTPFLVEPNEPENITMNLFDYWIVGGTGPIDSEGPPTPGTTQYGSDPTNENGNPWYNVQGWEIQDELIGSQYDSGINYNHLLKFFRTSPSQGNTDLHLAPQYGIWNHSTQAVTQNYMGIVARKLNQNGYPVLNLNGDAAANANRLRTPVDGDARRTAASESLEYLFKPDDDNAGQGKASHANVTGLLQLNEEGYYYYDSKLNFAEYDGAGEFKLYNTWAVEPHPDSQSPQGQFFPFNTAQQVFAGVRTVDEATGEQELIQKTNAADGVNSRDAQVLDHHLGFTMEVEFQQMTDGQINRGIEEPKDVTFRFAGDDDIWVFVDDVLVLDMGGVHSGVYGEINFHTGQVLIGPMDYKVAQGAALDTSEGAWPAQRFTLYGLFKDALGDKADTEVAWNKAQRTFADGTLHTLKLFYMERGHWDSNFAMYFNFPPVIPQQIYKVEEDGRALDDATFNIYAATLKPGAWDSDDFQTSLEDHLHYDSAGQLQLTDEDIAFWAQYQPGASFDASRWYTADQFIKVNEDGTFTQAQDSIEALDEMETGKDLLEKGYAELDSEIDFAKRAAFGNTLYILEEITPPKGYRKLPNPIVLYYDAASNLFKVLNQYETGAYASFTAILEDNTSQLNYADIAKDDNGIYTIVESGDAISDPHQEDALLFAVPMIYTDIGEGANWYPIYGSNTHGYHIVDIYGGNDEEALLKNLLAAALRQTAEENAPDWYFQYERVSNTSGQQNVSLSHYVAELHNLPGDPDRYLINGAVNGQLPTPKIGEHDLRIVGLLVDASALANLISDKTLDDIDKMDDYEKFAALQKNLIGRKFAEKWDEQYEADTQDWKDLKDILNTAYGMSDDSNLVHDERGVNLAYINSFTRKYGSVIYIPNERRELRVRKENAEGEPLAGAEFEMYATFDDAAAKRNAIAAGKTDKDGLLVFAYLDPKLVDDEDKTEQEKTAKRDGFTSINWETYTDEDYDHDNLLWIREVTPPKQGDTEYELNEGIVEVYVGSHTIYANASAYNEARELIDDPTGKNAAEMQKWEGTDNIYVMATVGKLFQSMEKYADSLLNTTLLDIVGDDYIYIPSNVDEFHDPEDREHQPDSASNRKYWAYTGNGKHLHFWGADKLEKYTTSDYSGNHKKPDDDITDTFSSTENGYIWMRPKQDADFADHHKDEQGTLNSYRDVLRASDGTALDISGVFSPVNVIVVRDLRLDEYEQFKGDKIIEGRELGEYDRDKFAFTLTPVSDNNPPMPDGTIGNAYTVRNGVYYDTNDDTQAIGPGEIIFPQIEYDEPGVYVYKISEAFVTEGNPAHVLIGTEEVYVTVTVSWMDDTDHNQGLKTSVSYSLDEEGNEPLTGLRFTFTNPYVGGLAITKTAKPVPDDNRAFEFTVVFTNERGVPLEGEHDYTVYNDRNEVLRSGRLKSGEKLELRHGEVAIFDKLPVGTQYTITETEDPDYKPEEDVYEKTGSIFDPEPDNSMAYAEFVNVTTLEKGNLAITKIVEPAPDPAPGDLWFTFKVHLWTQDNERLEEPKYKYPYTIVDADDPNDPKIVKDKGFIWDGGEIKLRHGETAIITELPGGVSYSVTELEASVYDATVTGSENGSILPGATQWVTYTNRAVGDLDVTKYVYPVPKDGDPGPEFKFTVKLTLPAAASESRVFSYTVRDIDGKEQSTKQFLVPAGATDVTVDVALRHGQTATFTDLPGGTAYAADEPDSLGYTKTVLVGEEGEIVVGDTQRVIYLNTKCKADAVSARLFATKDIIGDRGFERDKDSGKYTFKLEAVEPTLDAPMPTGDNPIVNSGRIVVFGDINYNTEGTWYYAIKEIASANDDVPVETGKAIYVKVEVTRDPNTQALNVSVQYRLDENSDKWEDDPFDFVNTYSSDAPGSLVVTKTVTGEGDPTDTFEFRFYFTNSDNQPLTGSFPYTITYPDGSVSATQYIQHNRVVTLMHGQRMTITQLPVGTVYTVTETSKDGYSTTISGTAEPTTDGGGNVSGTGTIKADSAESAHFENYKGDATRVPVSGVKLLNGKAPGSERFWYTIKRIAPANAPLPNPSVVTNNDEGEFSFGSITFTETGTYTYSVTETTEHRPGYRYDTNEYIVTVIVRKDASGELVAVSSISLEGHEATGGIVFKNTYEKPKPGDLVVTKTVSGEAGDAEQYFNFTVTLSDTTINGKYGDMEFVDGVATFMLKHGEKMTAKGLPGDILYTVTEAEENANGYETTVRNGSGHTSSAGTVTVDFENHRDELPPVPATGDDMDLALWTSLMLLSMAAIVLCARRMRRAI